MNLFNNLLFIDIETVSITRTYQELSERYKQHWNRKSQFIPNSSGLTSEELFFERAAIYSEFGKIIVIAVGYMDQNPEKPQLRIKSFYGEDEAQILTDFKELINSKFNPATVQFCAHNGKEFDYPYLGRRMMIHAIELPVPLQLSGKKPWEVKHFDTLEMWKFGDRKQFTSLDLLATVFDIPSSKTGLDGSKVNETYYKEHGLDRINDYCKKDVEVLAQVFMRMNYLPLLSAEQIVYV
jgi:hypothetical protein